MATTEEQKILDIKVRYEDALYGIIRYKEKIDALKASLKDLRVQEKNDVITKNEAKVQTEAINATIKEYHYNVRTLQKEIQNNVRTENEQEGSLKQLRAQLSNATKAFDELSRAEREGAKGKELQNKINKITDELKLAEEQTQRMYRNVGNYYNSMLDLAADLQHIVPMGGGGGVGEFTNSVVALGTNLQGIIPKIKAFGTTLMGLASNPLFMALAGVTGAGMAFKWWFDYNKGLLEATRLTREFTGYTGDALETMRNSISATADVMGKDFKEVLSTADALMSQYHLSGEQAIKVINDGFASGADLSGDMLSKIQQYAPTFHDAGIGASELVAILQQTRSGIFSDKGMDLITMASKKIREMSSGTASALDAIGISSKQVLKDLQSGTKSTFDIIQETATKLKGFSNDSQEVGAVLKDVFGKQGAAAGLQLIEQLDTMTTKIDEVKEQTGEWGKTQEENIELQRELNQSLSSLFDMSQNGFGKLIAKGKQFGTKILITILHGLIGIKGICLGIFNVFANGGSIVSTFWNTFNRAVESASNAMAGFGDIARGVLNLDFDAIKKGWDRVSSNMAKAWTTTKKAWNNAGKIAGESFSDGLMEAYTKRVDGGATSSATTVGNNGTVSSSTGSGGKTSSKTSNNEAKLEAERQKQQQQQMQADIAKVQFEYNEKVMDAKKRFLAGMYEKDSEYKDELEALDKEMIARSLDVYVQAGKIGEEKAQEMQVKLLDIMVAAKDKLARQAKETADKMKAEFEVVERETQFNNVMTNNEDGNSDEARLERYKAFLQKKIDAEKDHIEVLKELWAEYDKAEMESEEAIMKRKEELHKQEEDAQKVSLENIASMISAFGDGLADFLESEDKSFHNFLKSMLTSLLDAIEIAVNAYYAQIMAKEMASKSWGGVASAAAMMVLVKAAFAGAKALVKGFSTGGYVSGDGTATSDSIPAMLSNGESVMNAKATSMFSPILSAFNQLGGGVPIIANGGGGGYQMGEDMLAAAVAKGFAMAPHPVVSVEEISRTQNRVKAIERLGRI